MKTALVLFVLCLAFRPVIAQDKQLRTLLDSIQAEAELMYQYERAIWSASDLHFTGQHNDADYGNYVVYHSGDSVIVTFVGKSGERSIARYYFQRLNLRKPIHVDVSSTALSAQEKELYDVKIKMLGQLDDEKFGLQLYEGFNPNFVMLKDGREFRMYMIMGTTKPGIIPLGNDYLFQADYTGNITSWKKFHSRLLPVETTSGDMKILSALHNHLE